MRKNQKYFIIGGAALAACVAVVIAAILVSSGGSNNKTIVQGKEGASTKTVTLPEKPAYTEPGEASGTTPTATTTTKSQPTKTAPAAVPATPSSAPGHSGVTACDANVSVNSVTTCPFAENVFHAYWKLFNEGNRQGETPVEASSPTTHQSYNMMCIGREKSGAVIVHCSGGNNASVIFPLKAVEEY